MNALQSELLNRAIQAHQKGNLKSAQEWYDKLTQELPPHPQILLLGGFLALAQHKIPLAKERFLNCLQLDPKQVDALFTLGDLNLDEGNPRGAEIYYKKGLKESSNSIEGWMGLGQALFSLDKFEEAYSCFLQASQLDPQNVDLQYNLGILAKQLKQETSAFQHFSQVPSHHPSHLSAHLHASDSLIKTGRYQEALDLLLQHKNADDPSIQLNLGRALEALKRQDDAIECYLQFLQKEPHHAGVCNNVGGYLKEKKRLTEALSYFERCLELDPHCLPAYSNLFQCRRDLCDWTNHDSRMTDFLSLCQQCLDQNQSPPVAPFYALGLPFTEAQLLQIAQLYGVRYEIPIEEQLLQPRQRKREQRVRLGYVTSNVHDHPGNHLICGLFEQHNSSQFEVFIYSFGGESDSPYRQRVVNAVEHFVDITSLSDREAAQQIARDQIDILIDLKGYTRNHRPRIFCYRPCEIQIQYLGFAGSTGLPAHQYILTDPIVCPPESAPFYSETFLYLPHQYQVNDHLAPIAQDSITRADYHLPEKSFVFCCFNQSYKIEPHTFHLWMRILKNVPQSVLWLLPFTPEVQENLRKEAQSQGVDGHRLIFAHREPRDRHLQRHCFADLFLDTYRYNAHTTASDALRMGVPLITLPGSTFASRVAKSLLYAVGLPELVCQTEEEYVELAIRLAQNPSHLKKHKDFLKKEALNSPLLHTPSFARGLESVLESVNYSPPK